MIDLAQARLLSQHIPQADFTTPEEVVHWMGAVQAQDYHGALWTIALRMKKPDITVVEKAIETGQIIRTWPMRGTLHFVSNRDAKWMVNLMGPKATRKATSRRAGLGITDEVIERCKAILQNALQGKRYRSRPDIFALFEEAGIAPGNQRGIHILQYLAENAFICFGPHIGKQPSFVLFDEWLPKVPELSRDEALKELALRYFTSHGPASENDFASWTGLTLTDIRKGIELADSKLKNFEQNGKKFWYNAHSKLDTRPAASLFLLPGFDEYMLGYRDRSAMLALERSNHIVPGGNGMFLPTIVKNGRVIGTWKRKVKARSIEIAILPFQKLPEQIVKEISKVAKRYANYLGHKNVTLV
jgi:hypothetical protein